MNTKDDYIILGVKEDKRKTLLEEKFIISIEDKES